MDSFEKTFELFKQGMSLPEIAFNRKLAFSTIETHFGILLEKKLILVEDLIPVEKIELIKKVLPEKPAGLSEIKNLLPANISFTEIKWVLISMGKIQYKKFKPPIVKAINIYFGNCCTRKCFNHPQLVEDCQNNFKKLAESFGFDEISVSEFFKLMTSGELKICKLSQEKRKQIVYWSKFEELQEKNKDFWDN